MAMFFGTSQDVVAIDGKALRRSFDRTGGRSMLCSASARACKDCLVLGQFAADRKSNGITAVPKETRSDADWTDTEWSRKNHQWLGLAAVGKVDRIRIMPGESHSRNRVFPAQSGASAKSLGRIGGLNQRLGVRDEGQLITRLGNGPRNLAVLRSTH
jgi:hypothetical protein